MIDYVANYLETIEKRRVTPSIEPGYLKHLLPSSAPEEPEGFDDIMKDVEDKVMIGVRRDVFLKDPCRMEGKRPAARNSCKTCWFVFRSR